MSEEAAKSFEEKLTQKLGRTCDLAWNVDGKGVTCGWCRLESSADIYAVAEVVVSFQGRVMTISPLNTPSDLAAPPSAAESALYQAPASNEAIHVVVNYHFYFNKINLTATISLANQERTVKSITPVLISADWHEREMQELYNIKIQGHPHAQRLLLDPTIHMTDHTMIPLSEALNGASTSTLWEKIMQSGRKGEETR